MTKRLFFLGILMLISYPARADQVILKDGGVVQGKVVEQTPGKVVVEDIDGVRSSYQMGSVEKVVKESRGAGEQIETEIGTATQTAEMPELVLQNGHIGTVECVKFSNDGKYLASGSSDNNIKIWDVKSGSLLYTLTGHSDPIRVLAFTNDGEKLISLTDFNIIIWSTESGRLLFRVCHKIT